MSLGYLVGAVMLKIAWNARWENFLLVKMVSSTFFVFVLFSLNHIAGFFQSAISPGIIDESSWYRACMRSSKLKRNRISPEVMIDDAGILKTEKLRLTFWMVMSMVAKIWVKSTEEILDHLVVLKMTINGNIRHFKSMILSRFYCKTLR